MSLAVTVDGIDRYTDRHLVVPTSKLALIRWGLVCSRPWWISDPALGRWTAWTSTPPGLADVAVAELLEARRVTCLFGSYLREDALGSPLETTPAFHALHGAALEEASSRLDAAVAGQLAWSLLDVPALHHVGWTAPYLGISPDPGARRPDYAGRDGGDPGGWVVLSAAEQVPRVRQVAHHEVALCGAVVALPDADGGRLEAYVERPEAGPDDGARADLDLDLDPDALHEQRYARFAWALAAGLAPRPVEVRCPGAARSMSLRLFPLGVTGYVGVTAELAEAIEAALAGPVAGRRARFAREARAVQRALAAEGATAGAPKAFAVGSRRIARLSGPHEIEIDGIPHDVSVGPDGIALLLPSSIVRPATQPGPPAVFAA